ncbi:MAG: ABC transporter substrate-binding protein [Beijerinckiaceae bacterium]|nr:ABC transporter substrate-binding protein [Beijerinckiaceae bacterium]
MSADLTRRALGGAAAGLWMVTAADAQTRLPPVIGFLNSRTPADAAGVVQSFQRGLAETGYVEGRDVRIDYRWSDGYERLALMARELVESAVDVLFAAGSSASAQAAKEATASIPVVFAIGQDPVALGLVETLARPGRNVTGAQVQAGALAPKHLEMLRELSPNSTEFGAVLNAANPGLRSMEIEIVAAAREARVAMTTLHIANEDELDAAFARFAGLGVGGVIVGAEGWFVSRRQATAALAAKHRLVTIHHQREFVEAGALVSVGASLLDAYRQGGRYVGRILKGENPAVLPVVRNDRFEIAINLKTARSLGLSIPPAVLARADEVIE